MAVSNEKIKEYSRRIIRSRMRLLYNNAFYGLLLMHVSFAIEESCKTAATDGKTIVFGPSFLEKIDDRELDFILMHEILHIVFQHCFRSSGYDKEQYNIAADIVINSNILFSNQMDINSITLKEYGTSMHLTPNNHEGYLFTTEEVYEMLSQSGILANLPGNRKKTNNEEEDNISEENESSDAGTGDGKDTDDADEASESNTDESDNSETNKSDGHNESGNKNEDEDSKDDNTGGGNTESDSNSTDESSSHGGSLQNSYSNSLEDSAFDSLSKPLDIDGFRDDHSKWGNENEEDNKENQKKWTTILEKTCETISIRNNSNNRGGLPLFAERFFKELKEGKIDWHQILNSFIQEDINDYSFAPPDKRFYDSPFLIPDYNEKVEKIKNILFMIDASGSMSDDTITEVFSEIKGAIDQFNGNLQGWVGFFEMTVTDLIPFENEYDLAAIRPRGGGGTSFYSIFNYVQNKMQDTKPESIVILTDGCAPFPEERMAQGIPVLWLLTNRSVNPPWGEVARIE